jgi:hypothetical protein
MLKPQLTSYGRDQNHPESRNQDQKVAHNHELCYTSSVHSSPQRGLSPANVVSVGGAASCLAVGESTLSADIHLTTLDNIYGRMYL